MDTTQAQAFALFLQQRIANCSAKQAELAADNRTDEAIFERIRGNVFKIFHTVFNVAWKTSGGDYAKAHSFFSDKLDRLPQNWQTALKAAQKHGDVKRITEEQIKLNAWEEIRTQFALLWKE